MAPSLRILRRERDRAARQLLSVQGWKCPHTEVAAAVASMLADSGRSKPALAWMLRQMEDLPDQTDATEKLADFAIAVLLLARAEGESVAETEPRTAPFITLTPRFH